MRGLEDSFDVAKLDAALNFRIVQDGGVRRFEVDRQLHREVYAELGELRLNARGPPAAEPGVEVLISPRVCESDDPQPVIRPGFGILDDPLENRELRVLQVAGIGLEENRPCPLVDFPGRTGNRGGNGRIGRCDWWSGVSDDRCRRGSGGRWSRGFDRRADWA